MGARLPDGRYMDDSGKVHRSYNDALAETRTKKDRAVQERLLRQSQMYYQAANDQAAQAQANKSWMGWIPGVGQQLDRVIERNLNDKAAAASAIAARQGQVGIYKAAMGEGPLPRTEDNVAAKKTPNPAPEIAPGLTAPVAYGDPAERAREAEQRRMMQQYASKEYWGTEQGKAMLALGNQDRYTGQDLGGFYKAQGAVGIGSFDEVIGGLAQLDDRYKEGGDLRKWAEANKTLALREYMKRVPQGQAPDPSQGDIKTAMDQGKFYAPENSPNPLAERSQLVAGVDPGITMGPPAGVNGVLNREQTAAIQATIPQAAATDTGTKAMNMQPSSAMATGYQLPARAIAPGNMPDDVGAALDPNAVAVRELWKRKIQGAAQYQGG